MAFDSIERMKLLAVMAAIVHAGLGETDYSYDKAIDAAIGVAKDLLLKLEQPNAD